jgi:hypothetical protein
MIPKWYSNYKKKIDESIEKCLNMYFNSIEENTNENVNYKFSVLNSFSEAVYYATK